MANDLAMLRIQYCSILIKVTGNNTIAGSHRRYLWNVISMSCLVTFGRNILLGKEEKGNEQLLCFNKNISFLC
jgi:hypothetical protein